MEIYLHTGEQQIGPWGIGQVKQALQMGSISPDSTMAWFQGCSEWIPLHQVPGISLVHPPPSGQTGDATGGLIPYKNSQALLSYYLGVFGLIPFVGLLLATPAVILAVTGMKKAKSNPQIKGTFHAWVGLILGSLSLLYHGVFILILVLNPFG